MCTPFNWHTSKGGNCASALFEQTNSSVGIQYAPQRRRKPKNRFRARISVQYTRRNRNENHRRTTELELGFVFVFGKYSGVDKFRVYARL